MQDKKNLENNFLNQSMYILLVLLLINMWHQMESYIEAQEPVIMSKYMIYWICCCQNNSIDDCDWEDDAFETTANNNETQTQTQPQRATTTRAAGQQSSSSQADITLCTQTESIENSNQRFETLTKALYQIFNFENKMNKNKSIQWISKHKLNKYDIWNIYANTNGNKNDENNDNYENENVNKSKDEPQSLPSLQITLSVQSSSILNFDFDGSKAAKEYTHDRGLRSIVCKMTEITMQQGEMSLNGVNIIKNCTILRWIHIYNEICM